MADTDELLPLQLAQRPVQLRDYQAAVISRVDEKIAAGARRILLVAPTGAGKTIIAAAFIAATLRNAPTDGVQR